PVAKDGLDAGRPDTVWFSRMSLHLSRSLDRDVRPIPRIARAVDDDAVVNHHVVKRLLWKRGRRHDQRRQNSNANLFHTRVTAMFSRSSIALSSRRGQLANRGDRRTRFAVYS